MSKKIAILGKLETKHQAPFCDDSWEIWSMGVHHDQHLLPRVDKWFDIHLAPTRIEHGTNHRKDFPMSECEDIVGGKYFNNTFSFLIAYAVIQGASDIAFYGSRFAHDHDLRAGQYHNVREMIFFAKGRGINVSDYDGVLTKQHLCSDGRDFDS